MKDIKIGSSDSGKLFSIRMEKPSIAKLKDQLKILSSIAPEDQILLIGPPFKQLQDITSGVGPDQKIFLYNRASLNQKSKDNVKTLLGPLQILEPEPIVESNLDFPNQESPLFSAFKEFEKGFLRNLAKGRAYLQTCELAGVNCQKCIEEHNVQWESLLAAISNLQDHFESAKFSVRNGQQRAQEQQAIHKALLDNFDSDLQLLDSIVLHPALLDFQVPNLSNMLKSDPQTLEAINNSDESQAITSISTLLANAMERVGMEASMEGPRVTLTLLDCLPVEKEKAWAAQCKEEHAKIESSLAQISTLFETISSNLTDISSVSREDIINEVSLTNAYQQINKSIDDSKLALMQLTSDYQFVYESIMNYCRESSEGSENAIGSLLVVLEQKRAAQENKILKPMEAQCMVAMEAKNTICQSKHDLTRFVQKKLREIATVQSEIQYKLKSGIAMMKKWQKGHNQYFTHLEHVSKLPEAYESFLLEIVRRKAYDKIFELKIRDASNDIAQFRAIETSRREAFTVSALPHLPPLFFKMVPSLHKKPPFFNPSLTDAQVLPDITIDDVQELRRLRSLSPIPVKVLQYQMRQSDDNKSSILRINSLSEVDLKGSSSAGESYNESIGSIIFPADYLPDYSVLQLSKEDIEKKCADLELKNVLLVQQVFDMSRQLEGFNNSSSAVNSANRAVAGLDTMPLYAAAALTLQVDVDNTFKPAATSSPADKKTSSPIAATTNSAMETATAIPIPSPKKIFAIEASSSLSSNNTDEAGTSNDARIRELEEKLKVQSEQILSLQSLNNELHSVLDGERLHKNMLEQEYATALSKMDELNNALTTYQVSDEIMQHQLLDVYQCLKCQVMVDDSCSSSSSSSSSGKAAAEQIDEFEDPRMENMTPLRRLITQRLNDIDSLARDGLKSKHLKMEALSQIGCDVPTSDVAFEKISYRKFEAGNLALFIPTPNKKHYIAFNQFCPHHYLTHECLDMMPKKQYLVCRIVFIEPATIATKSNNPFDLAEGTEFYSVTVEVPETGNGET